jgi:MarR family transcriptional repressor of emrRAB
MTSAAVDDRLVNIVGALALALSDAVGSATHEASGHGGAAPAALVSLLDLLDGRSIDDLRHAIDVTHSGGVRLLDRLVRDGLAQRRAGADARSIAVVLTPRGRRLARRTQEARRAALADALDVLDDREQAQLTAIAEKLVRTVVSTRLDDRSSGTEPAGGWLCRMCDPVACGRPHGTCPAASAALDWSAEP